MTIVQKASKMVLSAVLFFLSCAMAFAQSSAITGTVMDQMGEPIVGASVVQKGTTNGTSTDIDGNFSINVPQGSTIVISFVGYETQEVVVNGKKFDITLDENAEMLSETVVIGYGTMTRKDVTSSITTVKADDLNKGVFSDAASMLQGKVAGLIVTTTGDPNGNPSITLRGASSLREGEAMSPYYVIDGIPGVDIAMVAPDDIESIDVLRDATATAIYGSKAANGVIIITTKSGSRNERTNVSYSGYIAFDNILKTLDVASAQDIRDYVDKNNIDYGYDGGSSTDWQDEVMRTGKTHNHNISINGGSQKVKYMGSVNLSNRKGVVTGSERNRVNVRSLISAKVLKDKLDLSIGLNAMYGKNQGVPMGNEGASVMDAMNYYNPTFAIKNADGTWTQGSGSKNYNPLSLIAEDSSNTYHKKMQLVTKASLNIIEGLSWNVNYQFANNQFTYSAYDSHESQLDGVKALNGRARRSTYFGSEKTFETYGNYDHLFADTHKLSVMAGYSWEERTYNDGFGLTVHDFYNDKLKWNQLTYASTIDGIAGGVESGTKETVRNISFYGRVGYSYNSRYMLQATIRRDGSSVFGKDNRWGSFPSVSVAWNLTEEGFMDGQDIFDNLKLRLGYGVSGNALGFGAYTATATYGATGFFQYDGKDWRTLGATKNANPDLKWESTGMFNIGVDYSLLGGRINGSIEWYNKKTEDLIWNYPVSTNIYPVNWIAANVGEISNKGIEVSINATPVQTDKFTWSTTLNLSHNENIVEKLSNDKFEVGTYTQGDPMVAGVSANGYTQRIMEGEALGTFYLYEFAGYKDGKASYYVHDAETGKRTGETTTTPEFKDRVIAGCAQPKLNLGWNNTFNIGNFNASMFFTGVFGNKIYNGSRAHYTSPELFSTGKNVLKEFVKDRPATDNLSNLPSDRFLEDGDYLRLQSLTLGYTFNKFDDWIRDLQLYVTCNNVFTITNYKGLDPEVNMGGLSPGIEYRWSTYPHTRTVLVGLKVNF
ncbi:MAG: TonB-dependent receptor [Bacteroidia bacterium]|nr:TonB-dependent receptor [Bacteroidia bacterium]